MRITGHAGAEPVTGKDGSFIWNWKDGTIRHELSPDPLGEYDASVSTELGPCGCAGSRRNTNGRIFPDLERVGGSSGLEIIEDDGSCHVWNIASGARKELEETHVLAGCRRGWIGQEKDRDQWYPEQL